MLLVTDQPAAAGQTFLRSGRGIKTWHLAAVTAVVGTIAYYLPLLGALLPGHAHWPGFMLTGDQRMAYFPSFVEGYRRFWHGGLLGIDFFTDDGASVFAYRPNLMPFYPPFLLAYLLADCSDLRTGMLAYVTINVLHQFAGLYFTVVFVRRFLDFPAAAAVLAATIYGLTWYAATYSGEATFYFQIMMLPVAACSLCWLMRTRSRLAPIWMSAVFTSFALSNYGPTMLASLGLAIVAALIGFVLRADGPGPSRLRRLIAPTSSLALAGLVCSPYFYAQVKYKALLAPTADDIDPVAHDLAFSAYDLLNGLSQFLDFHRTHFEAILVWGVIPIFLCLVGLDVLLARKDQIRPRYLWATGLAALVYLATLLPTLGSSLLTAADAFYYAVPFLGKMHIFQRYLAFSNFFFAIAVAGLATVAVLYASPGTKRATAYGGIAIWLCVTVACLIWPPPPTTHVGALLAEVFLLAVAAVTLAAAPPTAALLVVSALCALTGLYTAYAIPLATNRIRQWTTEPDPLGPEVREMVAFIKANDGGKALSKVVVANAEIMAYFNRNLPWMLGREVKLMNFQGYPPHLAVLADYSTQVFGAYGTYSLPWLRKTGADFVFWSDAASGLLGPLLAAGYHIGPALGMPGGNHLGKLNGPDAGSAQKALLDLSPGNAAQWPTAMELDGWKVQDGHLVKTQGQQNRFGYHVDQIPGQTYDVALDVDEGTTGHLTVAFGNKVVDELDLNGARHYSRSVTTSTPGDLWVTASPPFTGTLSNISVTASTDAPAAADPSLETFDNGILRVSGPHGAVRGFNTDYTKRIHMEIDAPANSTVTYLLWPNPYMIPYVDGQPSAWTDPSSRPVSLDIAPGHHRFELKFESRSGKLFIWLQLAYAVLVAAALTAEGVRRPTFRHYRQRFGLLRG